MHIDRFADQPQRLLHLDEIQVCDRFVSEGISPTAQSRATATRCCLTSAQITGSMIRIPFREIDARTGTIRHAYATLRVLSRPA